jgi:hypothetical protein
MLKKTPSDLDVKAEISLESSVYVFMDRSEMDDYIANHKMEKGFYPSFTFETEIFEFPKSILVKEFSFKFNPLHFNPEILEQKRKKSQVVHKIFKDKSPRKHSKFLMKKKVKMVTKKIITCDKIMQYVISRDDNLDDPEFLYSFAINQAIFLLNV